jgi:Protein of unknown function (DUF3089)
MGVHECPLQSRYAKDLAVIVNRSAAMPTTRISVLCIVAVMAGILSGALIGVALAQAPGEWESRRLTPPAPDYANPDAWAALPGRPSAADVVPPDSNAADLQEGPRADLFFVHPTTYMTAPSKNARYDEPGMTRERLDFHVLSFDAAAFNACCRVFVPRYRQASIASFFAPGPLSLATFDLAYSDVARAFDYYISHYNGGRPFIVASHSQGSLHAMRLLQDRIIGTPLQRRLVAAYLIGWAIPEDVERAGLPVCRSALQSGCVIGWNSVTPTQTLDFMRDRAVLWLDGRYRLLADKEIICVNPLTWTKDGAAPATANLGSLPQPRPGEPMEPPIPELTGAVCKDGVLHVFLTHEMRHNVGYHPKLGSFHSFDYNLFYMNIRHNAAERVSAFLARRR